MPLCGFLLNHTEPRTASWFSCPRPPAPRIALMPLHPHPRTTRHGEVSPQHPLSLCNLLHMPFARVQLLVRANHSAKGCMLTCYKIGMVSDTVDISHMVVMPLVATLAKWE